jgi:hypothetical protein
LWEFKFTEIDLKVSQITQDNNINPLHKEGFENFRAGLEEFLIENEVTYIKDLAYFKVYSSASVESTDIIRTSGSFYGREWFSDVSVSSAEETEWYGKVIKLYNYETQFFLRYMTLLIYF